MHSARQIPTLLAAACALATGVVAQEKLHGPGWPNVIVPAPYLEPFEDDATRVPVAAPHAIATEALSNGAVVRTVAIPRRSMDLAYPLYDVDEHGTTWVRGSGYKASFGTDGTQYIPDLGARAPRNFPVSFGVRSVTSGGAQLEFDTAVVAQRDGAVVSFPRGTFTEQYVVAADSLEQRFVFESLPNRGEVVVSIAVHSEMTRRSDTEGFRFENELGHVRYGRAFALDQRGTKVAIESRPTADGIQLIVPAAFVATAELPLVIDPYMGTISVDVDTGSDWQADVAYDASTNSFLVVYENQFSGTDHDVYGRKYVDQVLQGTATIDFTSGDWRNPKVANNGLADNFLCVAQVGSAGSRSIHGRKIAASSLSLGTAFVISGAETGDKINPDVGGDPVVVGPTYACVVWQRLNTSGDSDIHMRLVGTGGVIGATPVFLSNNSASNDQFPSISKTDGQAPFATQNWNILWQHETSSTNDDVYGARILWDGTLVNGIFVAASTLENERAPSASEPADDHGAGRPWVAAYTLGSDLRLRVFNAQSVIGTSDILAVSGQTLGQPVITTDGRKFPFAYTTRTGVFPFFDTNLAAGTFNYVDGQVSYAETTVIASSTTLDETRPEIASTYTATLTNPWRNLITYDTYNGSDYDVHAAVYDTPTNAGGYVYCNGTAGACPCGNGNNGTSGLAGCASSVNPAGSRLDVSGVWSRSTDTTTLYAVGMPTSATCLFFQGAGQSLNGTVFGDGLRCATGATVRLATKTASGGAASLGYPLDAPIHTTGLIPVAGGWRYYQCWYRNAAVFCTSSTFNTSNAVALLWTP